MKLQQSLNEKIQAIENKDNNIMRKIFIERVVLSSGATGDSLLKAKNLLEYLTNRKAQIIASKKRIPDFGVMPGLQVGTMITLRGKEAIGMLKRLLGGIDNKLSEKQIKDNHFSFGIHEYIEIPEVEYKREIGIRGFNVTVVFARNGKRVVRKKIKRGALPKKQSVSQKEIINFMKENFKTKVG